MTAKTNDSAETSRPSHTLNSSDDAAKRRERCGLLLARAGARLLGVPTDESEGLTGWRTPTPLPRAPLAVLGVVSVRGRMLTILDPLALLGEGRAANAPTPNSILALRGDEQLALAVDQVEEVIEIFADEVEPLVDGTDGIVRGILRREQGPVTVLNVRELFAAAMQGEERRRRRF
ncbi:MAG TPA: chemotaxis protein CheW [Pyrinomonadaceae bacterium]|nr:chemotaxis protein CheW [Pyrinomonadaceae bacterium]